MKHTNDQSESKRIFSESSQSETDGTNGSPHTARSQAELRKYRRWRDRRREAHLVKSGKAPINRETQDYIDFALKWVPYGGAPVSDIFVRYGMSKARFIEELWRLVDEVSAAGIDVAERLELAYSREAVRSPARHGSRCALSNQSHVGG